MLKLDRLGWAEGFAFKSYGLRLGVRFNGAAPEVMDCFRKLLPAGWESSQSPIVDHLYSVIAGETVDIGTVDIGVRPAILAILNQRGGQCFIMLARV